MTDPRDEKYEELVKEYKELLAKYKNLLPQEDQEVDWHAYNYFEEGSFPDGRPKSN